MLNTTNGNENKSTWYSYRPVDNIPFRIIVLDTYDVSTIQGTTAERTQQAYDFLSAKNPNEINKHGVNWLSGLKGEDRRFLPYIGAISKEQLDFLDRTCQEADENDEKCLVMGHVQILPEVALVQRCFGIIKMSWKSFVSTTVLSDTLLGTIIQAGIKRTKRGYIT